MGRKNPQITVRLLFTVGLYSILLIGCSNREYNGECKTPEKFTQSEIVGKWHIDYDNFYIDDFDYAGTVNGHEELTFFNDGTYIQTFTSGGYKYTSELLAWEMVAGKPDAPKIKLYGMKYFTYGPDNIDATLDLGPQMTDRLRNQAERQRTGNYSLGTHVNYPQDGFLFLYPRLCSGQINLLQMVAGPRDPDSQGVVNPVFVQSEN